ncbi:uncharacterized protein BJ212DRAFT_1381251 [Suillus subaureus]|uniref:Uncharacterized protein n=1 Tax=Suillus subaureus TaxID=48587 RepID=A0A9P7E1V6_9AGAM|nr:uncharacterized protein BJ212DRAFT_1381251 [Suillus subaureus]KAG1808860.1 hypothetical protein BJ212DRAFT_1381251 [Suillus subaureus]
MQSRREGGGCGSMISILDLWYPFVARICVIGAKIPGFPVFHHILSSRPDVTPIAVTADAGPRGKKTRWVWRKLPCKTKTASFWNRCSSV